MDNKKTMYTVGIVVVVLIIAYLLWTRFTASNSSNNSGVTGEEGGKVTFNKNIKKLFTKRDVDSMKWRFDLSNYDDVKENADQIYSVVESGRMPCYAPWSRDKVNLFKRWIDHGMHH